MTSMWWFPALMIGLAVPGPAIAQTQARAEAGVQTETRVQASPPGRGPTQVQTQTQAQAQGQAQTPQARIDAAMEAAARAEIPTSLLSSKVVEGEAKRVPRERIAAAVEARLSALVRASAALRQGRVMNATAAELAVAADAMSAGVSESAISQLARTSSPERRIVAVAVLADMVRLGHPHDPAFARVNAAVAAQSTLANLQAEVASSAALANLQAEVGSQLNTNGLGSTLDGAAGATTGLGLNLAK